MPAKDRLAAFKAANQVKTVTVPVEKVDTKIEMSGIASMDRYFELVERLNSEMDAVASSVKKVRQKHSYIIMTPVTDERDKAELENLMESIKASAQKIRLELKGMEDDISVHEKANVISADLRIKKTQFSALSRKFTTVMSDYNKVQTDYKDQCRARIKRQLEISGRTVPTDSEIDQMLDSGNPQIFTQGIIAETQQAKQALADVEARHEDIMKLENHIRELRDMFVDMALLVESQGEMIDRIEYNVTHATEYIAQAKEETKQAMEYQSSARRKKICLIGVLIVVVIAVILAIVIPVVQKINAGSTGSETSPPVTVTVLVPVTLAPTSPAPPTAAPPATSVLTSRPSNS